MAGAPTVRVAGEGKRTNERDAEQDDCCNDDDCDLLAQGLLLLFRDKGGKLWPGFEGPVNVPLVAFGYVAGISASSFAGSTYIERVGGSQ